MKTQCSVNFTLEHKWDKWKGIAIEMVDQEFAKRKANAVRSRLYFVAFPKFSSDLSFDSSPIVWGKRKRLQEAGPKGENSEIVKALESILAKEVSTENVSAADFPANEI